MSARFTRQNETGSRSWCASRVGTSITCSARTSRRPEARRRHTELLVASRTNFSACSQLLSDWALLKRQAALDHDRLARPHRGTEAEEHDDLGDIVRRAAPFQHGARDGRTSLLLGPFD